MGSIIFNFSDLIIIGGQFKNAIYHRELSNDAANSTKVNSKKLVVFKRKEGDTKIIRQVLVTPYDPYLR